MCKHHPKWTLLGFDPGPLLREAVVLTTEPPYQGDGNNHLMMMMKMWVLTLHVYCLLAIIKQQASIIYFRPGLSTCLL